MNPTYLGEINLSEETLTHYGVKGMKWGIRRYEKNPGVKTGKRIKKFRAAEAKYDQIKKTDPKNRSALKSAKREMKNQYKLVKQAKLADEGQKLYSENKRITDNGRKIAYASAGVGIASKMLSMALNTNMLPVDVQLKLSKPVNTPLGKMTVSDLVTVSAAIVSTGALTADKLYKENQNRKLRAYYSYTNK